MLADDEPLLRTEHLTRVVGDRVLLDDVSVEVRRGDVVGIVGPSGAGKSSFLRLLNRLDEPTAGTVWLEGRDYRTLAPRELRRRVGMVMQTAALFPGTVADNVAFGPRQHGVTLAAEAVSRLLGQVGLAGFDDRDSEQLSGGEAQRVAVARALANEPSVLLLDEPTSALDEASKRGIEALLREIARARALTCLVITHDLAQAARMANRVLQLAAGRVQRIGDVREVLRAGYDLP
jgi:putative ABC transport system ATP-binding protein